MQRVQPHAAIGQPFIEFVHPERQHWVLPCAALNGSQRFAQSGNGGRGLGHGTTRNDERSCFVPVAASGQPDSARLVARGQITPARRVT